jgi:hypothetical protein
VKPDGTGDQPTIAAGILAAQTGDVILLADGTYYEHDLDFGGRAITIRSASGDPTKCIIDCQQMGGGFIFQSGETATSVLRGITVQNGAAERGAAIVCSNSGPTIANCIFTRDSASPQGNGGAMYLAGGGAIPTITNCIFTGNSAADGGAMYITLHANPTITNCIFVGNSATNGGAMYYLSIASGTITNCTFTGNTASSLGGAVFTFSGLVTVVASNCIFWGDRAGTGSETIGDSPVESIHSDVQGYVTVDGDVSSNIAADPLFVRNPSPGGDGQWGTSDDDYGDLHLQAGSPCIDQGNADFVTSPPFPTDSTGTPLDLDGNPRIQGRHPDQGAYESPYTNSTALIADAGADQTVTVPHDGNSATNTASVTLDGSGTSNPNGDTLTYAWDDGGADPATGVKPTLNLPAGTYFFTLTVTNGVGDVSADTVKIVVTPEANSTPSAKGQSLTTNQDTALGITLTGSDPDGSQDTLTYTVASGPTHGTLIGGSPFGTTDPSVTYKPTAGYFGPDSFTFTVTDPYGAVSSAATISLTVNSTDKTAPTITASADKTTIPQNNGKLVPVTISGKVTDNAGGSGVDPSSVRYAVVDEYGQTQPTGTISLKPDGSYSFTVNLPASRLDTDLNGRTFTITVSARDKAGNQGSKSVVVTVPHDQSKK